MKRTVSILLFILVLAGMTGNTAWASAEKEVKVRVSIADGSGRLVLTQEEIKVTDADGNGKYTIDEALYSAHEAKYNGGASAGYASELTEYGISLTKLWGIENGGSYGYYLNNASPMSLSDEIVSGDYINAFAYADLTGWSDRYTFFDRYNGAAVSGEEISLTLSATDYDEAWNPVTVPVADAVITIDGVATDYKTDGEGRVKFEISDEGTYVISATSDRQTIVPPVFVVTVESDFSLKWLIITASVVLTAAAITIIVIKLIKRRSEAGNKVE